MTFRKLTIVSILLICFGCVSGQTSSERLDTIVASFLMELRIKGVDTFCIYQDYCVGCEYSWKSVEDRCNFEGLYVPTYIFWLDKGRSYMTKKDNCFDYSIINIKSDSIWKFFFDNRSSIESEKIKIPQYVEVKNDQPQTYSSSVNHSWHQGIQFIVQQDTIINKDLDDYCFTKEIGIGQRKNINYDYNVNSFLSQLQKLIARIIKVEVPQENWKKTRR